MTTYITPDNLPQVGDLVIGRDGNYGNAQLILVLSDPIPNEVSWYALDTAYECQAWFLCHGDLMRARFRFDLGRKDIPERQKVCLNWMILQSVNDK